MSNLLIQVHQAQVLFRGAICFEALTFDWKVGESWAITGDSGALLSAFLEIIRGNAVISSGQINRPFVGSYLFEKQEQGTVHSFRDLIAYVSQKYEFRNRSNLQNFYFQQRFNSTASEETETVLELLSAVQPKIAGPWNLKNVTSLLRLEELLDQSLLKLSNGETRRLAIAVGLMHQPKLYLMDQPMTGLDAASRAEFGRLLNEIQAKGVHVMITASTQEIPEGITHIAHIQRDKSILKFTKKEFESDSIKPVIASSFDWTLLKELLLQSTHTYQKTIVRLLDLTITYGDKKILDHVSWQVKAGERWLLQGKNGTGKSTLISLLIGENPQAYSQDFWLFGRKRGTGESIWEVKRPIGFMAPELVRFFPSNQTCKKVILSGLFDTMGLFRKANVEQEELAENWIKLFRLEGYATIPLNTLSLEQQRWTLLARALIKKPELLILDEASQGMDEYQRKLFKKTIEQVCEMSSITLIYVSHYVEDVPKGVDQVFELK